MTNSQDYVLQCALAKDYAPLIFQLRSGADITLELRAFLADHLEGKRQGKGRGTSPRRNWEARRHYRLFYWLTEMMGNQRDHAYDIVADIHGISRRSAINFVKLAEKSGHAEEVRRQEKSAAKMLEIEATESEMKVIKGVYFKRKAEILQGVWRDPQMVEVQE